MSDARKCDKCGLLFEPIVGCVSIDVSVKGKGNNETYQSWSDVDFCCKCSAALLDVIGPALSGLSRPSGRKTRKAK